MKVCSITGVVGTQDYKINKSTQALIICSTKAMKDIADELINVSVQKANGNNVLIATKLKLRDFIAGSTYGMEAVQNDGTMKTVAICELTDGDGAYPILENENIVFSFEKLTDTATYDVYAVDDPLTSFELVSFDQKVLLTEEPSKTYFVSGYDLVLIDNASGALDKITVTYSNGSSCEFTAFELRAIMKDIDPIAVVESGGTVQQDLGRIVLPLSSPESEIAVEKIDFYKGTAGSVNLVFRSIKYRA